jgi:hypothetical protein
MYPSAPVYYAEPISAGDSIVASVTAKTTSTTTKYTLKISDTTKGWTKKVVKSTTSGERSSAEAVIEAPTSFPDVSSVNFTNVVFNGADLSTFDPVAVTTTGDNGGTTTYSPGAITNGDDFSVTPSTSG